MYISYPDTCNHHFCGDIADSCSYILNLPLSLCLVVVDELPGLRYNLTFLLSDRNCVITAFVTTAFVAIAFVTITLAHVNNRKVPLFNVNYHRITRIV